MVEGELVLSGIIALEALVEVFEADPAGRCGTGAGCEPRAGVGDLDDELVWRLAARVDVDAKRVGAGGAPMSPAIARRVLGLLRAPAAGPATAGGGELALLTEREREVLALVASGDADKEICEKLGVTRSTVKNHLTAIYDKWRVRSRTQAAVRFVKITQG